MTASISQTPRAGEGMWVTVIHCRLGKYTTDENQTLNLLQLHIKMEERHFEGPIITVSPEVYLAQREEGSKYFLQRFFI